MNSFSSKQFRTQVGLIQYDTVAENNKLKYPTNDIYIFIWIMGAHTLSVHRKLGYDFQRKLFAAVIPSIGIIVKQMKSQICVRKSIIKTESKGHTFRHRIIANSFFVVVAIISSTCLTFLSGQNETQC